MDLASSPHLPAALDDAARITPFRCLSTVLRPQPSALVRPLRGQDGFSLVELMIVMAIISLLATMAIQRFQGQRDRANRAVADRVLRTAYKTMLNERVAAGRDGFNTAFATPSFLNQQEPSMEATGLALTDTLANAQTGRVWAIVFDGTANPLVGYTETQLCTAVRGKFFDCLSLIDYEPDSPFLTYGSTVIDWSGGTRVIPDAEVDWARATDDNVLLVRSPLSLDPNTSFQAWNGTGYRAWTSLHDVRWQDCKPPVIYDTCGS